MYRCDSATDGETTVSNVRTPQNLNDRPILASMQLDVTATEWSYESYRI